MKDRDLVRLYWPVELRPAFDALFDIDDAMGNVVARATQPALAAIKLAWWRERLEALDRGEVPAEPRFGAAASELLPRGISGADLAALEVGWAQMLQQSPDAAAASERGALLFELGARLLGADEVEFGDAGRLFAGVDAARRGFGDFPIGQGRRLQFPSKVRPLTGLAALAARDVRRGRPFEAEATPGRAWTLLRHRRTGRL